jgi:hypothetical protein
VKDDFSLTQVLFKRGTTFILSRCIQKQQLKAIKADLIATGSAFKSKAGSFSTSLLTPIVAVNRVEKEILDIMRENFKKCSRC